MVAELSLEPDSIHMPKDARKALSLRLATWLKHDLDHGMRRKSKKSLDLVKDKARADNRRHRDLPELREEDSVLTHPSIRRRS